MLIMLSDPASPPDGAARSEITDLSAFAMQKEMADCATRNGIDLHTLFLALKEQLSDQFNQPSSDGAARVLSADNIAAIRELGRERITQQTFRNLLASVEALRADTLRLAEERETVLRYNGQLAADNAKLISENADLTGELDAAEQHVKILRESNNRLLALVEQRAALVEAWDEWYHKHSNSLMDTKAQAFARLERAVNALRAPSSEEP